VYLTLYLAGPQLSRGETLQVLPGAPLGALARCVDLTLFSQGLSTLRFSLGLPTLILRILGWLRVHLSPAQI